MVAQDIRAEPFKSEVRKTRSSGSVSSLVSMNLCDVEIDSQLIHRYQTTALSLLQTSKISSFFVTHVCLPGFELTTLSTLSKHSTLTLQTFLHMLVRLLTCSFCQLMSKRESQRAQTHNPLHTWQVYADITKFVKIWTFHFNPSGILYDF